MMHGRALAYLVSHPAEIALLRRCWADQETSSDADKAALADWVTRTVLGASIDHWEAETWPPVFHNCHPGAMHSELRGDD